MTRIPTVLVSDLICVDQSRMVFVQTLPQFKSGLTIEVQSNRHSARDARIRSMDEELHQGHRIRVDREARADAQRSVSVLPRNLL